MTDYPMIFYSPDIDLYSECTLPEDIFSNLKKNIDCDENNKIAYNKDLAGNIEKEYKVTGVDINFLRFVEKQAKCFFIKNLKNPKYSKYSEMKENQIEMKVESLWVNKQKKYEFNPIHNHNGVVSFVCWVKIPYNLEDELNLDNCKNSNTPRNSLFEFIFNGFCGEIISELIYVDKSYEGKCIFFNSNLHHQVYPFYTSDDYRISVSGNFVVKIEKPKNILYN